MDGGGGIFRLVVVTPSPPPTRENSGLPLLYHKVTWLYKYFSTKNSHPTIIVSFFFLGGGGVTSLADKGLLLQNPDDVNVIVINDWNHIFVGFSDKVCLSGAEKLLHWIIEYISRVSCFSRACVLTVNFLKAYCCFGWSGFLYLAFQRKVW